MKIYITKLIISRIDNNNYEAKIVSQANNNVIKYRIIDKLISVPKLKTTEVLVERTIMSRDNEIYIIDLLNYQILLHKKFNVNKKRFFKTLKLDNKFNAENLNKFITFDIESITDLDSLNHEGDKVYFDPILI